MEDRMPTGKDLEIANWVASIGAAYNLVRQGVKLSTHLPDDPFTARKAILSMGEKLKARHLDMLSPPPELMHQLESECVREKAEFWDQLGHACAARSWEIQGTTSRRLLNRGLFVEAQEEGVSIENLPVQTFHVPSLLKALEPVVDTLVPSGHDPQQFLDLVAQAYDSLGGGGEQSLEEIYRTVVWNSQKASFWKSLNPTQFVRVTRPQFRSRLTQTLQLAQRTSDGRELRFGTTVQTKEAWEIYSPGEGRVVQVGRMALL
jgi:hypothetical protein